MRSALRGIVVGRSLDLARSVGDAAFGGTDRGGGGLGSGAHRILPRASNSRDPVVEPDRRGWTAILVRFLLVVFSLPSVEGCNVHHVLSARAAGFAALSHCV